MRCDEARPAISQAMDHELPEDGTPAALHEHLQGCPECRAFERSVRRLRAELRMERVETTPDIAPGAVAAIATAVPLQADASLGPPPGQEALAAAPPWARPTGRRFGVAVAAATVVGALAGAAIVGWGVRRDTPSVGIASEPDVQVLLAWTPGSLEPELAATAESAPDVHAVSEVRGATVDLTGSHDAEGGPVDVLDAGWAIPMDAIAVAPEAHAEFAPVADRAAVAHLGPDEALLSQTSARLRGLSAGATLELAGGHELDVVAIVEDTTIGAAELAVDGATGRRIGIETPRYLLAAYDGDRAVVEWTLRDAVLAEVPIRFRAPDETPFLRHGDAVLPPLRLKDLFGEFRYRPPAPGTRVFDQEVAWQAEHLAQRELPLIGPVRCHRDILDAFEGALRDLQARNLGELIDPEGYAGCWNPRLVTAGGDLSHHAWGVAFDINYDNNPTGRPSAQDPRLVEVFEEWGFTSGEGWLVPDPAHFEYLRDPRNVSG